MKKILIILSMLMLIIINDKESNKILIPNDSIRIRVIANSNKLEDQLIKQRVRNNITNILEPELKNVKNIEEARKTINSNLEKIDNIVLKTLNNNNYKINYGDNYFPKKTYKGIEYKEGTYESLVINIGESKGDNWWCVLFPPICMIEVEEEDKNNVEYKSKILEIINKYQ